MASGPQAVRLVRVQNVPPAAAGAVRLDTIWTVGSRPDEPSATTFGAIANVQVDGRGRVLVVDMRAGAVRVLNSNGAYVTSFGRTGDGPGEFRLPTQVAISPDGAVFVLDAQNGTITELTAEYTYTRTIRLSHSMSSVRTLLVGQDRIHMSGVGASAPLRGRAIHTFSRTDGRHLLSFGALPPAAAPEISTMLGAGPIAHASGGGLWYAQLAPYRIRRYSASGELQIEIERENTFLPRADSAFAIVLDGGRVTTTARPHASAIRVRELDDGSLIHQTRLADGEIVTDMYSPAYELKWSARGVVGLSAHLSGDLYVSSMHLDGVPVVAAVRLDR